MHKPGGLGCIDNRCGIPALMLVLSRKAGEGFDIGGVVKIVVLSVSGNQVKIGIEAPEKVKVLRCELKDREKS